MFKSTAIVTKYQNRETHTHTVEERFHCFTFFRYLKCAKNKLDIQDEYNNKNIFAYIEICKNCNVSAMYTKFVSV